jgi:gamma-glutamylcyclotransferase (GGCT)/AIG2-like uncharacterized protein YtfP
MELSNVSEKKFYRTFIYGTLRRGQYNHKRFKGLSGHYKCDGVIRGYQLKPLGDYPAIVPSEGNEIVVGEIYELPESLHRVILRMEQNAGYLYRPVSVEVVANQEEAPGATYPVDAHAYIFCSPKLIERVKPIQSGDWINRR